ncbi:O-antigen ligase family protein [Algibacter sp. 2305UL17-15]|uniref:O-antigen ligase family protein n=1 Tax=Algibacter sp. 2305UL17-15 TaxID=3231268 RepID=UPI0034597BFA
MKRILRILILIFIMWGFPTFALFYISIGLGAITSYITILLLLVYFVFYVDNYRQPLLPFIFLGITYYTISGLNFLPTYGFVEDYLVFFIKFIIVVVCCTEVAKDSKIEEIFIVTIFGALSIVIHAVVFPTTDATFGDSYGRFSGFYLNPNYAAIVSLVGFSLSYGIKNAKLKMIGQLVFSFAGILTMSRYFILIWVLINIAAAISSRKNLAAPILGAIVLAFVLLSGTLKLNTSRFEALESIFSDEVKTETINDDSRTDTWAQFTDIILSKPFLGNGFRNLQGQGFRLNTGVHNLYLLVIGEAGIIAFAFLIYIIFFLITKSIKYYQSNFYYIFLTITVATSFLVGHTYFEKYSTIFITIFVYLKLSDLDKKNKQLLK